jgi:hypothetical protein
MDGVFKAIKTNKNQAIIIVEFSRGSRAPPAKEGEDCIKLCRNSMRILNKLLESVRDNAANYTTMRQRKGVLQFNEQTWGIMARSKNYPRTTRYPQSQGMVERGNAILEKKIARWMETHRLDEQTGQVFWVALCTQ